MAKAIVRAKVYDDMEQIDLGIGKDREIFLPKKFRDDKFTLSNVSKGLAIEKMKPRQSGCKMLSFNQQSTHLGVMHMINSLGPAISSVMLTQRKQVYKAEKKATLENQNEGRTSSRRIQQKSVHENDNAAEMLSKLVESNQHHRLIWNHLKEIHLALHTSYQCFKSHLRRRQMSHNMEIYIPCFHHTGRRSNWCNF